MAEILMPPGGQTTNSSVITKWYKKQGDYIKRGDILFSIETDKSTLDIESFAEGILSRCLFSEGDTAETGAVVAVIEKGAAGSAPNIENAPIAVVSTTEEKKNAAVTLPIDAGAGQPAAELNTVKTMGQKTLASPLAKITAREHNIDVSAVPSSSGAVKKADVIKFINTRPTQVSAVYGAEARAYVLIDADISALGFLLKKCNEKYGNAPGLEKYIRKAFDAAQKEYVLIQKYEIADIQRNDGLATVSAALYGNFDGQYIFGFMAKVKALVCDILMLLAM